MIHLTVPKYIRKTFIWTSQNFYVTIYRDENYFLILNLAFSFKQLLYHLDSKSEKQLS